jgi:hypothetical protein
VGDQRKSLAKQRRARARMRELDAQIEVLRRQHDSMPVS